MAVPLLISLIGSLGNHPGVIGKSGFSVHWCPQRAFCSLFYEIVQESAGHLVKNRCCKSIPLPSDRDSSYSDINQKKNPATPLHCYPTFFLNKILGLRLSPQAFRSLLLNKYYFDRITGSIPLGAGSDKQQINHENVAKKSMPVTLRA
jgi:hypothetical protein